MPNKAETKDSIRPLSDDEETLLLIFRFWLLQEPKESESLIRSWSLDSEAEKKEWSQIEGEKKGCAIWS